MRSLICAAILAAGPAIASQEMVAKQGEDQARITEKPCVNAEILRRIPENFRSEFRAASARFNGQQYEACWVIRGSNVYLVYADGDEGVIPASHFKESPGV